MSHETNQPTTSSNIIRISRRAILGGLAVAPALAAGLGAVLSRSAAAQDGGQLTMVTDTGGIDDGNFNSLTWLGVQQAGDQFGYTYRYLESLENSAFVPNMIEAATSSAMVIAVGFNLGDAVTEIAPQFPDIPFVFLDGVIEGDNIESFVFKEQEGGFLGGVAAAMYSTTKSLGVVGGQEIPPVIRYEVGFTAGARTVLGSAFQPLINYVGSFTDPSAGQAAASAQYDQGADIVFPIAGLTNNGIFQAARDRGLANSVIGVDSDQSAIGANEQVFFIGKALDVAVNDAVRSLSEDSFAGGVNNLGLAENGVSIGDPSGNLSAEITAAVEVYRQAIIASTIVVPADRDELAAFTPVVLEVPAGAATPGATPAATPVS